MSAVVEQSKIDAAVDRHFFMASREDAVITLNIRVEHSDGSSTTFNVGAFQEKEKFVKAIEKFNEMVGKEICGPEAWVCSKTAYRCWLECDFYLLNEGTFDLKRSERQKWQKEVKQYK